MERLNKVSSLTLTILTESSVALSNDQGFGNYTPIKKWFQNDGLHATSSVATITYEIRKALGEKGWHLSGMVLNTDRAGKVTNMYSKIDDIESGDNKSMETDVFGFLIPDKQLSKTSPLRIIPPKSIHSFKNDTQIITNKGFLNKDFGRQYYDKDGNEFPNDKFPQTQALANEEVFGDYYVYTITIELDRVGVLEVKDGKYLFPDERIYMDKSLREKAVVDIVDVITELTRTIKHQTIHLKPLAVFGGVFESVIPYFWNDVAFDRNNNLILERPIETIKSYDLNEENYIAVHSERINVKMRDNSNKAPENEADDTNTDKKDETKIHVGYPVKEIKNLARRLYVGEDNKWYLKNDEGKA